MKLTKRLISLILVFACLVAWVPVIGSHASDALPSELYLTQTQRGTCTLCSAAMMLRACAYYAGNDEWNQITENGIRPIAWLEGAGLYWSFTYTQSTTEMTVDHAYLSGVTISQLKALLDTYPDGIVLYCGNLPHAVYLIDYVGDTFYCAETVENYSGKRITLAESWLGNQYGSQANVLKNVTAYWYIKESNVVRDCGCSATYAGTYVCTTSSSNLTIRSGHGTDYSAIGSIPSGAEVYVSRASGEGNSDWAHVQYGGVSGYASMKYLSLKKDLAIRGSGSVVNLSMDSQKSAQLQFWTSGSYENPVSLSWSRSNTNVSCAWGDLDSGKFPLTITANKPGTTQITITATDSQTGDYLDKLVVDVTVGSKSYTVSYNANGGTGAPESQMKLAGMGLTLSDTVPTRLGYTFQGWSTNPGATAADYLPASGYLTDRDINLYAVWHMAAAIGSDVTDSDFSASIPFAGGHKSYRFIPSQTGEYTFASTGDLDSKLWIYSSDGTLVDSNNNGGPGDNFLLTAVLTGGSTYYLRVRSATPGVVNFSVVRNMPYITGQSANVTVGEGRTAYVTVTAAGSDLIYEWYYANAGLNNFVKDPGFSGNSYQAVMSNAVNGRQVYCVVTDKYGNQACSDVVTIRRISSESCQHKDHTTSGLCSDCCLKVAHSFVNQRCTVCGVGENAEQIKWQLTSNTKADSATTDLRLITYVDSLDNYSKVEFTLSYTDAAGKVRSAQFSCNSAYERLLANGNAVAPSSLFGSGANYFVTFLVTGVPNAQFSTEFTLTVRRYDRAGNLHSTATRFFSISDQFS